MKKKQQESKPFVDPFEALRKGLTLLGKSGVTAPGKKLESFPRPPALRDVTMISDEVTGLCPVTGQPDQYTVEIYYTPNKLCIESKALKLKLQSYRNVGIFCEQLANDLADHVFESIDPSVTRVRVTQKPRGGVSIVATARRSGTWRR